MKRYLKPYIILFLGIFLVNFLLQGMLLRGWNETHLMGIQSETFNIAPLILNYLIQSAGLVYLLDKLRVLDKPKEAAFWGGLFGGLLLINFGLSNLFLLPHYPIEMIISDTLATVVAFSLASYLAARFSR